MSHHGTQPSLRARFAARVVRLLQEDERQFPMGFGLTPVAAGANVLITANPQVNVQPVRLVIPDEIGKHFVVHDIRIGMRSQLLAAGAVPASAFSHLAHEVPRFRFDALNVGQFVTLDASNVNRVREIELPPPPAALPQLARRKGERKKDFLVRLEQRHSRMCELHRLHQDACAELSAQATQDGRVSFSAALFCIPLDTSSSDAGRHVRQLAIKVLERIARP